MAQGSCCCIGSIYFSAGFYLCEMKLIECVVWPNASKSSHKGSGGITTGVLPTNEMNMVEHLQLPCTWLHEHHLETSQQSETFTNSIPNQSNNKKIHLAVCWHSHQLCILGKQKINIIHSCSSRTASSKTHGKNRKGPQKIAFCSGNFLVKFEEKRYGGCEVIREERNMKDCFAVLRKKHTTKKQKPEPGCGRLENTPCFFQQHNPPHKWMHSYLSFSSHIFASTAPFQMKQKPINCPNYFLWNDVCCVFFGAVVA